MNDIKEKNPINTDSEDDLSCIDEEESSFKTEATMTPDIWSSYTPTGNRLDIFRFLSGNGWNITKSTFYRHIDGGKLRKNRGGVYTQLAVKKYAQTWAVRSCGKRVATGIEDLMEEKVRAEIDRIKIIKEREAFRLDVEQGKYILRADIGIKLAARVVVLEAEFDHIIDTKATELIALVNGRQENAEMLIATIKDGIKELLCQYADMREFEVISGDERNIPSN